MYMYTKHYLCAESEIGSDEKVEILYKVNILYTGKLLNQFRGGD